MAEFPEMENFEQFVDTVTDFIFFGEKAAAAPERVADVAAQVQMKRGANVVEDAERREYDSYRDSADGSATLADLFHAKDNS